jgi:UDP-N-acetylglucosamine:LPS N-acetylglucosamine transferase
MRLVVVSSSGGVLLDMLALRPWLDRHDVTWVAPPAADTEVLLRGERVRWQPERDGGDLARLPLDIARAAKALRKDDADCVVSAGTGIAVSWFVAAAGLRVPRLWFDTFNFVDRPGKVARACGRLASVVFTPRPSADPSRRRSVAVGLLY